MLIGLSGVAGAGKSTIAKAITRNVISFGTPIKKIATQHFGWDGVKDIKGRRLLQVLGTESGRAYNTNIWIDKTIKKYKEKSEELVIVDDVRFDNEIQAILDLHGAVYRVTGRGIKLGKNSNHKSEHGITINLPIIDNSGTVENSVIQIRRLIDETFYTF